ncbi:MAG: hypothetical protein AAGU19_09455 [Prolixibacteraceae bacterium]
MKPIGYDKKLNAFFIPSAGTISDAYFCHIVAQNKLGALIGENIGTFTRDITFVKLCQTPFTRIWFDVATRVIDVNTGTATKVKKLLGVIAESVPFKPNIAALARKLDLSRDSVYQYVYQLRDAKLLNTLSSEGKGVSALQKPDKIFLENTNLAFALKDKPDIGNIRETFVLNQLLNSGLQVNSPSEGDFKVNGLTIEVGGKNKNTSQVDHLDNYLIAAGDIEIGSGNKVPLWLFGFLY